MFYFSTLVLYTKLRETLMHKLHTLENLKQEMVGGILNVKIYNIKFEILLQLLDNRLEVLSYLSNNTNRVDWKGSTPVLWLI